MSTSSPALPAVIADYFAASERRDVDAIGGCFSDDAIVVDEGEQRRGRVEIRRWREDVDNTFEYTSTLKHWATSGITDGAHQYDVTMHLEGNFPGGEVDLINSFTIRDGRIVDLRIVPLQS